MTLAFIIIAAGFGASAIITQIGSLLIARAHPRRGCRIDIGGLCQHLVELEPAPGRGGLPLVLLHGAGCNLQYNDSNSRHRIPPSIDGFL